jgi:EAL domain-containing protein (putative c-di-GMP-specific phosphodiesterase class I)/AmiR/NasT family two-component response regulator
MTRESRVRVLIVEDDPAVRRAIAALIEGEPAFELVGAAADGRAGAELAEEHQPDVALVDIRMPHGGPDAVRAIARCSPRTKVLVLSASGDRATVLRLLEAGAVGYLVKGASISSIIESIKGAAAGQGSLSGEVAGDVIAELAGQLTTRRRAAERLSRQQARIRRAIEDESVLTMVFQPICNLSDRRPVGFEALARFRGPPKRGPEQWFAEATAVSLGRELELVAIRRALATLHDLPTTRYLSVNASPATLLSRGLRKALSEVDAARIVLELTEHAPIKSYQRLNAALERLRSIGVRLAIDDAGAGFASLRHILQLNPDFIKLDRTLINRIDGDRSQQALAGGLISFATGIGAAIVAEGIERAEDLQALVGLGVEYGQGYLLAKPGALDSRALNA